MKSKQPVHITLPISLCGQVERFRERLGCNRSEAYERLILEGLKHLGEGNGNGEAESEVGLYSLRRAILRDAEKFIERVGRDNLLRWMQFYEEQFGGVMVAPENFSQVDAVVARMFREGEPRGLSVGEMVDLREWIGICKKTAEVEAKIRDEVLKEPQPQPGASVVPVRVTLTQPDPQPPDPSETPPSVEVLPKGKAFVREINNTYQTYLKYKDPVTGKWKQKHLHASTPEEIAQYVKPKTDQGEVKVQVAAPTPLACCTPEAKDALYEIPS